MEFTSSPTQVQEKSLKPKHLKEGVKGIIACIGEPYHFDSERGIFAGVSPNQSVVDNIDFYGDPGKLREKEFKIPEERSYTISPINNADKFSRNFKNCVGLVVTGKDKKTGENISFASHQNPIYFLSSKAKKADFTNDLSQRFIELKERSEEGTIDAVMFGGKYFKPINVVSPTGKEELVEILSMMQGYKKEDYIESVKLISEEISKILGFEPTVVIGPKTTGGSDDMFYDNANRRLYVARLGKIGDDSTKSFAPSDIDEQKEKW